MLQERTCTIPVPVFGTRCKIDCPSGLPMEQCVTYREKSAGWNMLIQASAKKMYGSYLAYPLALVRTFMHYALAGFEPMDALWYDCSAMHLTTRPLLKIESILPSYVRLPVEYHKNIHCTMYLPIWGYMQKLLPLPMHTNNKKHNFPF